MTNPDQVSAYLASFTRTDSGRVLSYLVAQLRDFTLAEDSLQDAVESALVHWTRNGLPQSPAGWLMQTARRKAIDRLRRAANFRSKQAEISYLMELDAEDDLMDIHHIPDERLRLIFTCCHPSLAQKASVALTLRTLCGLTTEQIAKSFLLKPTTMAQRLVRAQGKIKNAGIAFKIPEAGELEERLLAVLDVIYLVFNAGFARQLDDQSQIDLCAEAIRLAHLLRNLMPENAEVEGLLALCLLQHSRVAARFGADGVLIPLEQQNRVKWNHVLIADGQELVERALKRRQPGPFQVQAAIASLQVSSSSHDSTDWHEIALLYGVLYDMRPNPVVQLNQIVAQSYAEGPAHALVSLGAVEHDLRNYQPFFAVRADIYRRLSQTGSALEDYLTAIELSDDASQIRFLESRCDELRGRLN